MKPVYQTRSGIGVGNCLACCIASILEIKLEDIDMGEFKVNANGEVDGEDFLTRLFKKLDQLGWGLLQAHLHFFNKQVKKDKHSKGYTGLLTDCHCIISYPWDKNNWNGGPWHSVVGYIDKNYKICVVHDPDPKAPMNTITEYKWDMNKFQLIEFLVKK